MDAESVRSIRSERSDKSKRNRFNNSSNEKIMNNNNNQVQNISVSQLNNMPSNMNQFQNSSLDQSSMVSVQNQQNIGYSQDSNAQIMQQNNQYPIMPNQNWNNQMVPYYAGQQNCQQFSNLSQQQQVSQNGIRPSLNNTMNQNNQFVQNPGAIINPYRSENTQTFYPMDENNWGDNATAVTGATSETGLSGDNMSKFGARFGLASLSANNASIVSGAAAALIKNESDDISSITLSHTLWILFIFLLIVCGLFSPFMMLILPHLPFTDEWNVSKCRSHCQTVIATVVIKMVFLTLGIWFYVNPKQPIFARKTSILSRIQMYKLLYLMLSLVILLVCWLLYFVYILQPKEKKYWNIANFTANCVDVFLFVFFTYIVVTYFHAYKKKYAISVLRSPDGCMKTYKFGEISVQEAAVEVLQNYVTDFPVYIAPSRRRGKNGNGASGQSKYKFYDVDGKPGDKNGNGDGSNPVPSASSRLHDEVESEKKIRKRRMRLLIAVEEAFVHVKKLSSDQHDEYKKGFDSAKGNKTESQNMDDPSLVPLTACNGSAVSSRRRSQPEKPLDPYEAAQAVFPTLIRPLQKYIRVTKQQARHPVDTVIHHLATCLAHDLSPLAFVEKFNPKLATPQQDAATASAAVVSAKRALRKQKSSPGGGSASGSVPTLPKSMAPGGQQKWQLVTGHSSTGHLAEGTVFQLRHGSDISLLCSVNRLPLFELVEDSLEQSINGSRFVLNSAAESNTV